jgi:hypothetical protein
MRTYFAGFEATANELLEKAFSRSQFEELIATLVPIPEDSKRGKTLAENTRDALMDCRVAPDLDLIRNTAWGAYNAVADYADHHALTRGENKASRLFERTFETSELKDQALELLLAR